MYKFEIEIMEIETLDTTGLKVKIEHDEIDTHIGTKIEEYRTVTGTLKMDYKEFKELCEFGLAEMIENEENELKISFVGYYEFEEVELKATGYFKKVDDKIEIEYEVV